MKLKINDRVTWSSAAGHLEGVIVDIVLSENGHNHTVPWIDIQTNRTTVRLCATHENLIGMRVDKITEIVMA
jgi:hypothetical protein